MIFSIVLLPRWTVVHVFLINWPVSVHFLKSPMSLSLGVWCFVCLFFCVCASLVWKSDQAVLFLLDKQDENSNLYQERLTSRKTLWDTFVTMAVYNLKYCLLPFTLFFWKHITNDIKGWHVWWLEITGSQQSVWPARKCPAPFTLVEAVYTDTLCCSCILYSTELSFNGLLKTAASPLSCLESRRQRATRASQELITVSACSLTPILLPVYLIR